MPHLGPKKTKKKSIILQGVIIGGIWLKAQGIALYYFLQLYINLQLSQIANLKN